jgi:glucose-1-phosphate adenylyltransferase
VRTPVVTASNSNWYRGTADAIYQNLNFLKNSHEPYVVIASGDCVYKMDFGKVLEYHIDKKADITVVCKEMDPDVNVERFGTIRLNEEQVIEEFEEKPIQARSHLISCGIYVIRRRLLIELIEKCAEEGNYDFVRDILVRYKGVKRIVGYQMKDYWRNIASVEDYYGTNMEFLKPEVRNYFFKQYPDIYSKVDDLPPAKYNVGANVKNSLVTSGCIINGVVENSVIFKKSYIGNNCVIKNSIILNDVYVGDNSYIENCIVESHGTIKADSRYVGENEIMIVLEKNERYVL